MITIERKIDELTIERFEFAVIDTTLYLDRYALLKKESKRHRNYTFLKRYDRQMDRYNTITEDQVPFTEEIRNEALELFKDTIKCLKWSERRR